MTLVMAKFLASISGPILSILVLIYLHYREVTEQAISSTGSPGLFPKLSTLIWGALVLSAFAFLVALLIYIEQKISITLDLSLVNWSVTILTLGLISLILSGIVLVAGATHLQFE
jgi:hypothetical protein